jgi:hypothetical protein
MWSAATHILLARIDRNDNQTLWLMDAESPVSIQVAGPLRPPDQAWFGYYGYIDRRALVHCTPCLRQYGRRGVGLAHIGQRAHPLVGLVICQGLTPVILGAAIGLAGAWAGARILERFLFGVTLHEPAIYAGAGVFTVAIAALACFLPARQAAKLPPAAALQAE